MHLKDKINDLYRTHNYTLDANEIASLLEADIDSVSEILNQQERAALSVILSGWPLTTGGVQHEAGLGEREAHAAVYRLRQRRKIRRGNWGWEPK